MRSLFRVAVSTSLLGAAILVLQLRSSGEAVPIPKRLDHFPSAIGEWRAREATILDERTLSILGTRDYVTRRDQDPRGRSVWLHIAYWGSQRKGNIIHSPRNCLPGAGWEPLEVSTVTIPLPAPGTAITVNRYLVQKQRDQQVVLFWFHSQGKAIAGELETRLELVKSSIIHRRTDGALVRVSSPVYTSAQEAAERLAAYVQALYPALGEFLPQ